MRLIDADDLPVSSVDFTDVGYYIEKYGTGIPVVYMEDINDAPTISPPTTTWLGNYCPYKCEHCGRYVDSKTPYCAWCGRKVSNYE